VLKLYSPDIDRVGKALSKAVDFDFIVVVIAVSGVGQEENRSGCCRKLLGRWGAGRRALVDHHLLLVLRVLLRLLVVLLQGKGGI
jgi:hypothetical protein